MNFFRFYFLDLRLSRKANGFSLVELMVVVGILAIINIMIFASYPEFSQRMALKRTSEEIALIARQAQAYALGIKRSASGGDDYFGFGVHFETGNPKSLILFTDSGQGNSQPNKQYDARGGCGQPQTECFQEFKIDTGDIIFKLECDSCDENIDALDIVYPRATSMASISADGNNCGCSYARVIIKSPRGNEDKHKKYISIWANGQISVEDPPKN